MNIIVKAIFLFAMPCCMNANFIIRERNNNVGFWFNVRFGIVLINFVNSLAGSNKKGEQ